MPTSPRLPIFPAQPTRAARPAPIRRPLRPGRKPVLSFMSARNSHRPAGTSEMLKRLFRPETLFFLLTWLGLMVAFRDRGFYDPGALWHIKVGEIILDRGMPQTDPFSYTFE